MHVLIKLFILFYANKDVKMEKMHKCNHMHGILFENVHEDA